MANTETPASAEQFELSLKSLEDLVSRLEQGDLPLEEALKAFEKGVGLTQTCQHILQEAEQKVEQLTQKAGEMSIEPVENSD